jgi:hypothetical protein
MRETVVTSFSNRGFHDYGDRFIKTFEKFWPADVDLVVYFEAPFASDRAQKRDIFEDTDLSDFLSRHCASAQKAGRLPDPRWKDSDRERGYSYRFDALKFCRKVFAIADAARRIEEGVLTWIDADVYTHTRVPGCFTLAMLGGADVAYLGREPAHSECGYLGFRLPDALPLIETWESFYASDEVFNLSEWHDSYVFDYARGMNPNLRYRNLTPGGRRHCWVDSPLATVMDHRKGTRKMLDMSPEMAGRVRR